MGKFIGTEVEYAFITSVTFRHNIPNEPSETEGFRHLVDIAVVCQDENRAVVSVPIPTSKTFVLRDTPKMISMEEWLDYIKSDEGQAALRDAIAVMKKDFAGYEG